MINNKKVILFICQSIEDDDDAQHLYNILSYIDQERYIPIAYLPAEKGSLSSRLRDENICKVIIEKHLHPYRKFKRIPGNPLLITNFIQRTVLITKKLTGLIYLSLFKLPYIIQKEKTDVLYSYKTTVFFMTFVAGLITLTEVVHHVKILPGKFSRYPLKMVTATPVIKKIICASKYAMDHYPVNPNKATVIYDGIDTTEFRKSSINGQLRNAHHIPKEAIVVGVAGSVMCEQGFIHFLRAGKIAIEACQDYDLRLVMMVWLTDSDEMKPLNDLKYLAKEMNINQKVILIVSNTDLNIYYVDLDILVIPALRPDSSSKILLEGMALSLPVIAYGTGSIPEIVDNNYTGLLYKPGDYVNLGKGMIQFIKHKYIRTLMGAAGRDRVEKCYDAYMKTWEIEDVL